MSKCEQWLIFLDLLNKRVAESNTPDPHDFIQVVQGAGWHSVIYTFIQTEERKQIKKIYSW